MPASAHELHEFPRIKTPVHRLHRFTQITGCFFPFSPSHLLNFPPSQLPSFAALPPFRASCFFPTPWSPTPALTSRTKRRGNGIEYHFYVFLVKNQGCFG